MEWMDCSISQWCSSSHHHSDSHQHSSSCQWRRSWSSGCQREDPQVTSHCGQPEGVLTAEGPQTTSHQKGTVRGWAQPSSSSQQKWHVTFAEGRAPSSSEDSPERDARIDEAHQLPPPTWQDERVGNERSNWSRLEAGEEEDLECPLLLKPYLQELLGGEDLAGTEVPYDPEPSPLHQMDWIQWHTHQIEMLTWWTQLQEVSRDNACWEFAWKVHVSFVVPKACNQAKGVDNDYTPPLTHPSLGKYRFMLPPHLRFGSQDCWLAQSCQTLAYMRVLQYWVKRASHWSPVNHAIWWRVWWSSGRQWSHWSPLQRRKFLWPVCPLFGWRSVHPGQQKPPHKTPTAAAAVAEAAKSTQEGPYWWPMVWSNPSLPR